MEILSIAIMYVLGIWASVYLILNGHPWFGAFILIGTFSIRYTSRPTKRKPLAARFAKKGFVMYEVKKLTPDSAEELEKLCNEAVKHGYRLVAMNEKFCVFENLPLDNL